MAVSVLVPWRPSGPERGRCWAFVNRWWADRHPQIPVRTTLAPAGDWCKARALMPAVESSAADIIVMADADVICDGVEDAIHAVEDGAPWAVPHTMVHRLDAAGTDRFVAGDNSSPSYQQAPYRGVLGGGMVIARREVVLSIPPDCRFVGWG